MSGWGQVFDRLFDTSKINIVNYSMGGRSLKTMYQEGRLNDVLMTGHKGDLYLCSLVIMMKRMERQGRCK